MTILTVQNNRKAQAELSKTLLELVPDAEILNCPTSPEALAMARTKEIDIAFIDMDQTEMSALDLGQYLKDLYPSVNLIFLTNDRRDAFDAMALRASGCLLRKCEKDKVSAEMASLRYPVGADRPKRAFAQTFGNFEFFVDGTPVVFKYSRTKDPGQQPRRADDQRRDHCLPLGR